MTGGTNSLFANAFEVPALSEADVFEEILQRLTYPRRMLPSFLHESTHHWCFRSPVGNALALARLTIARERTAAMTEAIDWSRVAKPLYAYTVVDMMMRPLIEGMALFAEFDLLPQAETNVASILAQNVGIFFRENDTETDPTTLLRTPLIAMRQTLPAAERKAITYLSPGSLDGDGYLLGYAAVKQIWLAASHAHPPFRDTDLFLLFFRSYLFADHELAIMLLDPVGDMNDYLVRLTNHIAGRVRSMFALEFDKVVPIFTQAVETMTSRKLAPEFSEPVPWDCESRRRLFDTLIDDFLTGKSGGENAEKFGAFGSMVLTARNVMKIGRIPALVPSKPRPAALPEFTDLKTWFDAMNQGDEQKVIGQKELYLLPAHHVHVILDRVGDLVTDFRLLGELPEGVTPDDVRDWLATFDGIHTAVASAEVLIEDAEQSLSEQVANVRSTARGEAERFYERYVFMNGDVDLVARAAVDRSGLWSIFEADTQFIFDLARLSNLFGAGFRGGKLVQACNAIGLPYRVIILRLMKIEQRINWPLLYGDLVRNEIYGIL